MRYLMCVINKDGQTSHDYTVVDTVEEERINKLMQSKRLPDVWDLKGKRIVTDTILGFTDNPLAPQAAPKEPKIKSFDELRQWVHQQQWYQKKYGKPKTPEQKSESVPLLELPPVVSPKSNGKTLA